MIFTNPIMEDIFIVYNLEIRFVFILSYTLKNFSFTANTWTHVRYAKGAVIQAAINNK